MNGVHLFKGIKPAPFRGGISVALQDHAVILGGKEADT